MSDPRRSYFDLEADGCADEIELARMKADRLSLLTEPSYLAPKEGS